jgi:hypothetical protein
MARLDLMNRIHSNGNRDRRTRRSQLSCEQLETRLAPAAAVVSLQLTELYQEFLPYKAAGQVASFVPSNDLESLRVTNGKVAIDVRAFTNTSAEVKSLGGQVTAVRYLPVAYGMPGIDVQAMLPIAELPALGKLADVVTVTPQYRVGPADGAAPSITTNPKDQTVDAGSHVTFTAAASGVASPTVQWQVSSDGGKIFRRIAGATSSTLTFTALAGQSGNEYRAVFTNELGEVSTTTAKLTVKADAALEAMSGSISGTYDVPFTVPDVGHGYHLSGSGTLGANGLVQASGELTTPGFITMGTAGGTLTLSNAGGTVTLSLESEPVPGFSSLPQEFSYHVQSATGTFAGLSAQGTITIILTPASGSGGAASAQHGTFTLTIHPGSSGRITGTYDVPFTVPDVGHGYHLSGSGTIGGWGSVQASGELTTPGFIVQSTAGGTLTVSNAGGTVTLSLESEPVPGFSSLPQEFKYHVQSATGTFAGLSAQGTITIILTPVTGSGGPASAQHGTFTLTIHPGPASPSQHTRDGAGVPILARGDTWLTIHEPPQQRVLQSAQDLLAVTGLTESQLAALLHVKAIDWKTQMIVTVSNGFGAYGAFSPRANITELTASDHTLTVHWQWQKPDPNQIFPQFLALMNPFDFVLVNRFAGQVKFQLDGQGSQAV